ncbi:ABC transporter ATP-binding protein [Terrihabitans rhizophilus]|uniref:ATP-binding cassette domain-containing protein n=1 Tax=Terrihabitans rhizophilus TaxID=3092662 RepID=A0ABU4RIZ4_9HYPH|nr:ATP-binding cassette domain-containing protein [Terrihabitans sp. PJ23]MDX6804792.1 ATP-binding cassette domain-containing protein [Terrihabitans sp. PJ23]
MSGPALVIDGLTVEFGRFRAVDNLSLVVDYGQVHALIGPNGAGKSTVLNVIAGVSPAKSGRISLGDIELTGLTEAQIARHGVRRKFQKPSVFEALTVRENIEIGLGVAPGRAPAGRIEEVLDMVDLTSLAAASAGALAHGQKQWLEIGMVLASDPKILMLDEPVAGLTDEERARTASLVRALRRPDRAIIVVEHDMGFVEQIADKVTVLHEGRTLFEGPMSRVRADPRVVEVYLGR